VSEESEVRNQKKGISLKSSVSPSLTSVVAALVLLAAVFGCANSANSSHAPPATGDDDASPGDDDDVSPSDDDSSPDDDDLSPADDDISPADDDVSPDDDDVSPADDDASPADDDASPADDDASPTDDDTVLDPGFVRVDHGTFTMGSPVDEPGRNYDEVQHPVTLTHDFEMLALPIQQNDFIDLMGYNPSYFQSCGGQCPVESVSWFDALAYADQRSAAAGLTPCFVFADVQCADGTIAGANYLGCMNAAQRGIALAEVSLSGVSSVYDCAGFRLPTEAEAEFAERSGTTTAFYSGPITYPTGCSPVDPNLNLIGWYCGNDDVMPAAVGMKVPNALGIYDMSSDVWQWTWDEYGSYPTGPVTNPEGPASNPLPRWTGRGGSFNNPAEYCRSAFRFNWTAGEDNASVGFRIAKSLN
jgi:formylglycine-generating enzyme required for sulfatase activity